MEGGTHNVLRWFQCGAIQRGMGVGGGGGGDNKLPPYDEDTTNGIQSEGGRNIFRTSYFPIWSPHFHIIN